MQASLDASERELEEIERDIKRLQATGLISDFSEGGDGGSVGGADAASAVMDPDDLMVIFNYYANFGRTSVMSAQNMMDSFMFMKLVKECPDLLDRKSVGRGEVDLIFTKCKAKSERRITFDGFLDALLALAQKRYPDLGAREAQLQLCRAQLQPLLAHVRVEMARSSDTAPGSDDMPAAFKRLTDVRSYTGVYAERFRSGDGRINGDSDGRAGRGYAGNTNGATNEVIHDISAFMRPHLATGGTVLPLTSSSRFQRSQSPARQRRLSSPDRDPLTTPPPTGSTTLLSLSHIAAAPSASASEVVSVRHTGLAAWLGGVGGPATATTATDRATHAASMQHRDPHEAQTEALLQAISTARAGGDVSALCELTLQLATQVKQAQASVDALKKVSAAEAEIDVSEAASVQKEIAALENDVAALQLRLEKTPSDSAAAVAINNQIASLRDRLIELRCSESYTALYSEPPALSRSNLEEIFEFYANFGRSSVMTPQKSMDSFMFMKFCRECPSLMDATLLTRTDVDLIFTKAKPKAERRLVFERFLDALAAIAERKFPYCASVDALKQLLRLHLSPLHEIVKAELEKTEPGVAPLKGVYAKLTDPRSYTGVYAERFRSGDGRINGDSDGRAGRGYAGNTNGATNEVIHDIAAFMRPHLRSGSTQMALAPRVRETNKEAMSAYLRREEVQRLGRRAYSPQARMRRPSSPGPSASPFHHAAAAAPATGPHSSSYVSIAAANRQRRASFTAEDATAAKRRIEF